MKKYCVEYIVVDNAGKTRLIVLDELPEAQMIEIDDAAPEHRLSLIEPLRGEYGFANASNYDDGDTWKRYPPGTYIRVCDDAAIFHEEDE